MSNGEIKYNKIVEKANEWRARMSRLDVHAGDRDAFEAWLSEDDRHRTAYEEAVTYWDAYKQISIDDLDADLLAPSFAEKLTSFLDAARSATKSIRLRSALAVSVVALAFLPVVLMQIGPSRTDTETHQNIVAKIEHSTGIGEIKELTLNDGTKVTLSAETQITVSMSAHVRRVEMSDGAALFEVASDPDRPFSVASEGVIATALGTIYEVRSGGGTTRVSVAEGVVEVALPFFLGDKRTSIAVRETLDAGQQIVASDNSGQRQIKQVLPERIGAWRDNILIFDSATLPEIVADANRFSETNIVLYGLPPEILEREISASFKASDIDGLLGTLPALFPVRINRDNESTIEIRGEINNEK